MEEIGVYEIGRAMMKMEKVKPAGIRKLLFAVDLTVVADGYQISKNN